MLIKKLYSRFKGIQIGDTAYQKSSPFIVGNFHHFLPPDLWTEEDKRSVKRRYDEYKWDGLRWVYIKTIEKEGYNADTNTEKGRKEEGLS